MESLICYCFGYTASDIEQDFLANGTSTIMERIMAEKKAGGCQCATKNPTGR
uniref:BFD-like (2Fe-2S) protein n=1 Tax=Desulfobacca acetoxidans TaxID=60893 RepID=A0A7V6A687_9BACT